MRKVNHKTTHLEATAHQSLEGRALASEGNVGAEAVIDEDFDVPEETETILEDLFKALRDTVSALLYISTRKELKGGSLLLRTPSCGTRQLKE